MTEATLSESRKRCTLTELQIRQIRNFRGRGFTLVQTAEALKLPLGTVKTFCHRHPKLLFTLPQDDEGVCRRCGLPVTQIPGRKKKMFCSRECRLRWWQEHRSCYSAHPQEPTECTHCGILFFGVRNGQKYCSHDCYIRHRFYKKDEQA